MAFFFQAEDGIRDGRVTGVQTCALPIYADSMHEPIVPPLAEQGHLACTEAELVAWGERFGRVAQPPLLVKIGRASCRERVSRSAVGGSVGKTGRGGSETAGEARPAAGGA